MNEIVILQSAEADWYSIYVRLGDKFDQAFLRAVQFLSDNHEMGPRVQATDYRRLLIPETPYGIFYSITGTRVLIAAILDLRQDPEQIKRRLRDLS